MISLYLFFKPLQAIKFIDNQFVNTYTFIIKKSKRRMSYQNSPKQSSSSHGSASEEYIKIVEQLVTPSLLQIDSDDDETLMKRMADLQPIFPILKKMNAHLTNQEKINLFLRDNNFRMRLTDKLRESVTIISSRISFSSTLLSKSIYIQSDTACLSLSSSNNRTSRTFVISTGR